MVEKWPTASEMMVSELSTVEAGDTLSVAFGSMHRQGFREIAVTERGKLAGFLSYETIGRRRSLSLTMKVRNLMSFPSTVPPRATLPEVAGRLLESEVNALCVVDPRDGKLLGTISGTQLVRHVRTVPGIAEMGVAQEMTPIIGVLKDGDPSSALFSRDGDLRERALPVVDSRDRLVGSVGFQELGEAFLRPMSSGKRDSGESHPAAGTTVGSIMRSNPPSVETTASIGDCARLMAQSGVPCVFVLAGGRPIGTLSVTDILSLVAQTDRAVEGTFVQISGLAGYADPSLLSAMDRVVENGMKRIAHVAKPVSLTLHFTPHSSRRLADSTVQAALRTEGGHLYRATRTDWNILGSVTTLLEELERQVKQTKSIDRHGIHSKSVRNMPPSSVELVEDGGVEDRLRDAFPKERRTRPSRRGGRA